MEMKDKKMSKTLSAGPVMTHFKFPHLSETMATMEGSHIVTHPGPKVYARQSFPLNQMIHKQESQAPKKE